MTKAKKEPNNKKKYIIIAIIVVVVGLLITFTPTIYTAVNNAKAKEEKTLETLKTKKIELELEQNEEFKDDGFSKRYYELNEEIKSVKQSINSLQASITFRYTFLPIIIIAIIVVVGGFSLVISIIVKDFNKMGSNFRPYETLVEHNKRALARQNANFEPPTTKLKPLKCPSCKANLEHGAVKCEYCGTNIVKVKK